MNLKSLLKQLVETESPTSDKAAVDRVGAIVAEECRKLGGAIEIIPNESTGNHILARFHPSSPIPHPSALILCHMDTVFPIGTLQTFPYREDGDLIRGPGVSDMKSGIVIALGAISALLSSGKQNLPITALFTSDEETGSHTSRAWIEALAKESQIVFVMEPALADGSLKTARKGVGGYTVTVKGRAAHAGGAHKDGRNAIEEAAHQVIAIQKLTDYEKGTTLNVGVINGGFTSNVVPEECSIDVDFRVTDPAEAGRIEAAMKNLKPVLQDTSITVEGGLNRPPFPYNELNQAAFKKAHEIARTVGIELTHGSTGGASDGNFVAPLGIPVLDGMGGIGEGYHSDREYIRADSLELRVKLLTALLKDW